jgi:hypothetical protein
MANALASPSCGLISLKFAANGIELQGVKLICEAISHNEQLVELDLSNGSDVANSNRLTSKSAPFI